VVHLRGTVLALLLGSGTTVKVGNDTLAFIVDDGGLVVLVAVNVLLQALLDKGIQVGDILVLSQDGFFTINIHRILVSALPGGGNGDVVDLLRFQETSLVQQLELGDEAVGLVAREHEGRGKNKY